MLVLDEAVRSFPRSRIIKRGSDPSGRLPRELLGHRHEAMRPSPIAEVCVPEL
jgi:hypothetical protein